MPIEEFKNPEDRRCFSEEIKAQLKNWDPATELLGLTTLQSEIDNLPDDVYGKSTSVIKSGLQGYVTAMWQRHIALQKLKALCQERIQNEETGSENVFANVIGDIDPDDPCPSGHRLIAIYFTGTPYEEDGRTRYQIYTQYNCMNPCGCIETFDTYNLDTYGIDNPIDYVLENCPDGPTTCHELFYSQEFYDQLKSGVRFVFEPVDTYYNIEEFFDDPNFVTGGMVLVGVLPYDKAIRKLKFLRFADDLGDDAVEEGAEQLSKNLLEEGIEQGAKHGDELAEIARREELIQELTEQGVKFSEENIVDIQRLPDGQIIWLETGTSGARGSGLNHVLEHSEEFAGMGISSDEIPDLIFTALQNGRRVGVQGVDRPIYEVVFKGETRYVAITVGSNGYIVGANPTRNPFK